MNAALVRFGGLAAFALVVIAIVGAIVSYTRTTSIALSAVQTAFVIAAFWSTKVLFNSRDFRRANVPIIGIVVLVLLFWLVRVLGFELLGDRPASRPDSSALNALRLSVLIVFLVLLAFLLWFSVGAMNFGRAAVGGGSVWMALGILYLAAIALLVIVAVAPVIVEARGTSAAGLMPETGVVGRIFLAGFVTAILVCHGIGLLIGANGLKTTD